MKDIFKNKKVVIGVVALVIAISGLTYFYVARENDSRYNKEVIEKITLASANVKSKEDRKQKLEDFKVLKGLVDSYNDDKKVDKKNKNEMKEVVEKAKDTLVKTYEDQINTIDTNHLDDDIGKLNEQNKALSEVKNQIRDEKEYGILSDEEIAKYNDKINLKMQDIDSKIKFLEEKKKEEEEKAKKELEEKRKAEEEAKAAEEQKRQEEARQQAQQNAASQGSYSSQSSVNAASGTPAQQGGGSNQQASTAPSNGSSSNNPIGAPGSSWWTGDNGFTIVQNPDGSFSGVDANGKVTDANPGGWLRKSQ
ncbi:hypothetical protein [Granulicatella sp.]